MLHGYTLIAVSHEQALNMLTETTKTKDRLDMGCAVTTIATHPTHGDMIVIENVAGPCAIALPQGSARWFTDSLLPTISR